MRRSASLALWSLAPLWACLPLLLALPAARADQGTIVGPAIVRDDGSLLVGGQTIALFGIYTPPADPRCQTWGGSTGCATRAALALSFKVRGFVTCLPQSRDGNGLLRAVCYLDRTGLDPGEDLAAYLIQQGWAMALPNAPFEYQAMERIAQVQGRGVWGIPADSVVPQRAWPR